MDLGSVAEDGKLRRKRDYTNLDVIERDVRSLAAVGVVRRSFRLSEGLGGLNSKLSACEGDAPGLCTEIKKPDSSMDFISNCFLFFFTISGKPGWNNDFTL